MQMETAEHKRFAAQCERQANWKHWGPYLSERTWEMMHEDYGDNGAGLVAKLIQQSAGQDA